MGHRRGGGDRHRPEAADYDQRKQLPAGRPGRVLALLPLRRRFIITVSGGTR